MGLDFTPRYVSGDTDKDIQKQVLIRQAQLAKELDLPLWVILQWPRWVNTSIRTKMCWYIMEITNVLMLEMSIPGQQGDPPSTSWKNKVNGCLGFYSLVSDWCWELNCNLSGFRQGSQRLCFMLLMGNPQLLWREWRLDIIFLYRPPYSAVSR